MSAPWAMDNNFLDIYNETNQVWQTRIRFEQVSNRRISDLQQFQRNILKDKDVKICELLVNNERLKDQLGALQNQVCFEN